MPEETVSHGSNSNGLLLAGLGSEPVPAGSPSESAMNEIFEGLTLLKLACRNGFMCKQFKWLIAGGVGVRTGACGISI